MPTIHSLEFDTIGWRINQQEQNKIEWVNQADDFILFSLNSKPLYQVGASIPTMTALRNGFRAMLAEVQGGLVSLEIVSLTALPAIRAFGKIPQKPHGMTYMGRLILPFREFTYSFELGGREHGTTGMRDTIVFTQMLQAGKVSTKNFPEGWAQDPYDTALKTGVLRNMADDEQWGDEFPDHPLSRVRKAMAQIQDTLVLNEELMKCEPLPLATDKGR